MLVLAVAGSASAAQVEQVEDGGFEETACPPPPYADQAAQDKAALECVNPIWPELGKLGYACRMPPCGPGPASGSGFFSFGAGSSEATGTTRQMVEIPTAPATLSFKIEIQEQAKSIESGFTVLLDTEVLYQKYGKELTTPYAVQTVDVSGYAGPGLKKLDFIYGCGEQSLGGKTCPIVNLDDVSLKTGTPDPPPTLPVLPPPAPPLLTPSPSPAVAPVGPAVKRLTCKKGFRKKTVKGKQRCVRKHRKRKHKPS